MQTQTKRGMERQIESEKGVRPGGEEDEVEEIGK